MADLSTDLMEEILARLKVNDLLRFKCVCKDWLSLINSSTFINRHYLYNFNQPCQLIHFNFYCRNTNTNWKYFYRFHPINRRFLRFEDVNFHPHLPFLNSVVSDLMGPVNGIFCIRFISGDLALSNPSMRELRPLPRSPVEFESKYALGFGFDHLFGGLKVIAMAWYGSPNPSFSFVYNSITDSWKTVESEVTNLGVWWNDHHAFVNGVYYWFAVDFDHSIFILAFDMRSDSDSFYRIEIPDHLVLVSELRFVGHGDSMALKLGKSVGCEHYDCSGEIWVCDDDSFALDLCRSLALSGYKFLSELWVMGEDGLWSKIWRYDADWLLPSTWRWMHKNYSFFDGDGGGYFLGAVSHHAYNESLVSIKRGREGEDDSIRAFLQDQTTSTMVRYL